MIGGARAGRPAVFALALRDREIVDAGDTLAHQALAVEFPIFVAVAAKPLAAIIMPFIGEAHGDAVVVESPDFLDQAVVELTSPFARQERFDGLAALQELGAIAPAAIGRIGKCYAAGIAGVPGVFGHARLLRGGLSGEGRKRWAAHDGSPCQIALISPPSIRSVAPVIQRPGGERRKAMSAAMSSGWP